MIAVQGSAEWHKQRAGRATASKFADIISNGRGGKPSQKAETYKQTLVCERLIGEHIGFEGNADTRRGQELESQAVAEYEWQTGNAVDVTGFIIHPLNDMVGGSPDGLVGLDGLIEVKCPANPAYHLRTIRSGEVPSEYVAQVQGNLWVTGRQWADFVSYDPRFPKNLRLVTVRVTRDSDFIDELEDKVFRFVEQVEIITNKLLARA